jgi:hypothetical protein
VKLGFWPPARGDSSGVRFSGGADAPSARSAVFICGTVGFDSDPNNLSGPPVVTLDGVSSAIADARGMYSFDGVTLSSPAGLPANNHALVVHGDRVRTKVVRFTEDWLARMPADTVRGCKLVNLAVSSAPSGRSAGPIDAVEVRGSGLVDADGDAVDDYIEDWLSERFAPVVYHGEQETNFPVNVDWWLERTNLSIVDALSEPPRIQRVVTGPLAQNQLLNHIWPASNGQEISSDGTRSRGKSLSFFLENVDPQHRSGEMMNPAAWVTYVHSYPNEQGGITLQYWRAYTWNDARFLLVDLSHGGDWEGIAVHLNSSLRPQNVAYYEHTGIVLEKTDVQIAGTHPLVWSEEGSHSSYPDSRRLRSSRWVRQETWTGGQVIWWDDTNRGTSGGLLNVGERTRTRNQQVFIKYSGLWGAIGRLFVTSGYWGPSFNETGARCANGSDAYTQTLRYEAENSSCGRIFLRAWCDAMEGALLKVSEECYAQIDSP